MYSRYSPKEGTNNEDIQEMNRSLLIRLLRQMSVCSRADLAKVTGLKRATITNIISDLMDWGLVKEVGIIDGKNGRRSIGITINSEIYKVIGVRLARKYFSVGLYDIAGKEYLNRTEEIKEPFSPDATLEKIKSIIKEFLEAEGTNKFIAIGCAIPGPFFRNEGKMALITELPGWERILIQQELQSTFGLPVYLEHDANVGALAEWWLGLNRRKVGTLVYVAAGQGIGAGIVIDGKVYRGSLGIAGEIGHTSIAYDGPKCECGNNGCLTNYSSTLALMREIKKELPNYPQSILNKN
jgi:N-acetylglucosamine repressor